MAAPPDLPPPEELLKRADDMLKHFEGGRWPSHVSELRRTGYPLHVYGVGLVARKSPWGPSTAPVQFVSTGVLARVAREWVPGRGEEVHFRVFHTPGKFLPASFLRKLAELSRRLGVGLLEVVGQTGALVINLRKEHAEQLVDELRAIGTDVGGSGDAIRALNACVGPALCEFALFDTLAWYAEFHRDKRVNDAIATPGFPYKFKIKLSGCPMDCARANRADFGLVGIWEGAPEVDQEALRRKVEAGEVDPRRLEERCPSRAITWDERSRALIINGERCRKSMNCIRSAFPAIRPGRNRKVAVLVGGGVKGRFGPKLGWFLTMLDPDKPRDAIDLAFKVIEPWDREGVPKDRLGDYILKVGFTEFLRRLGMEASGRHVANPTYIPYKVLQREERDKFLKLSEELGR